MQPKSGKPAGSARLATIGVELSRAAQVPPRLDGLLSQDWERGPDLSAFRNFAPNLLPLAQAL